MNQRAGTRDTNQPKNKRVSNIIQTFMLGIGISAALTTFTTDATTLIHHWSWIVAGGVLFLRLVVEITLERKFRRHVVFLAAIGLYCVILHLIRLWTG